MKIQEIHRQAIKLAKEAQLEFDNENILGYQDLILKAFELEKTAAEFLKNNFESEPTRSILYRSAATLAFKCEKYFDTIDLITEALKGNPFEEIKIELLELLKKAVGNRTTPLKSNDYLNLLNKRAVSVKLEEKTGKYAGAFVIPHVVEFLKNLNQSYQNYAEAQFIKEIDRDSVPDFEYSLNDFKNKSNLLGSYTSFSSFGINISAENSLMEHFNIHTKEFKDMKENLFDEFKEDVLYSNYEDPTFHKRISDKFNEEERRKIFNPILNSIAKSKGYKISITDYEFKEKIKEFKAPNNIIKQALTPPPIINATPQLETETSLTRKIEQSTGNKKKIIFAENIKYLEQEFTLTDLEFEKKKIYFNDPNVILLIFENNYYRIDDDNYKIAVSNKDFDGLLELYSKSFIMKLIAMLENKSNLSDEENDLLIHYQNTTIRDW